MAEVVQKQFAVISLLEKKLGFDECYKRTLCFSRDITDEQYALLDAFARKALGYAISKNTLSYIGHLFCAREYMGHGRLAGDLLDAVLRGVCALSFAQRGQKNFSYLEIGILHGINFVATYDSIRHYFEKVSFTAIDPFDGYYGKNTDVALGIPVNEQSFRTNLKLFAVPPEDIAIYKGSSADSAIQQAQAAKKFDMMFIDGDHSYEGLKLDCEYYCGLLNSQGLLIIDNYHDTDWPEVTRFIDTELLHNPSYSVLGVLGRSVIFRKR